VETRVAGVGSDRRTHGRLTGLIEHGVGEARVRPAHVVVLVDISAGGALIQTSHRLLPGARIEIHLRTMSEVHVAKGCVIRCRVVRLRADAITYEGAVAFDRVASWLLPAAAREYDVPEAEGRSNSPTWAGITRGAPASWRRARNDDSL